MGVSSHVFVVREDGGLWAWGANDSGQIGNASYSIQQTPIKIMDNIIYASAGQMHSMAINKEKKLYVWGDNAYSQLGDGGTSLKNTPFFLMDGVKKACGGWGHTLILKENGELWAHGLNLNGQLGDGTTTIKRRPVLITTGIKDISAGFDHSMAINQQDELLMWGGNGFGQLGRGSTSTSSIPLKIMENVSKIEGGMYTSVIVTKSKVLMGAGNNENFQIASPGATASVTSFREISKDVTDASVGATHMVFRKSSGEVFVLGDNTDFQKGYGSTTQNNTEKATQRLIISGALQLMTGINFTGVLTTDKKITMFGRNSSAQLGMGNRGTYSMRVSPKINGVMDLMSNLNRKLFAKYLIESNGSLFYYNLNEWRGVD